MIKLDKQPSQLGVYLNTPTQKHGDERVPAKVLGVKNRMLTKAELNELLGDDHAWDMMYIEKKGTPPEPFWRDKLAKFRLAITKFVNCDVKITFGLKQHEVIFADATVKSLVLEPATGGLTALSFTIVCLKSHISGDLAKLDEHLNGSADVFLVLGDPDDEEAEDEDQDELDLDHAA